MKKIHLNVKGMHCAACEKLVKEVLTDEGASAASCNYKTGKVFVEFDEKKLPEQRIKELIRKEGYEVQ